MSRHDLPRSCFFLLKSLSITRISLTVGVGEQRLFLGEYSSLFNLSKLISYMFSFFNADTSDEYIYLTSLISACLIDRFRKLSMWFKTTFSYSLLKKGEVLPEGDCYCFIFMKSGDFECFFRAVAKLLDLEVSLNSDIFIGLLVLDIGVTFLLLRCAGGGERSTGFITPWYSNDYFIIAVGVMLNMVYAVLSFALLYNQSLFLFVLRLVLIFGRRVGVYSSLNFPGSIPTL